MEKKFFLISTSIMFLANANNIFITHTSKLIDNHIGKYLSKNGEHPFSSLTTVGNDGYLYGTTNEGGNEYGTIFKINPATNELTTLYKFSGTDGDKPSGSLTTMGNDGFLYGTTEDGGYHHGTIFKINPITNELTTLYKFSGTDGANPSGSLITMNNDAFLYGTTYSGGNSNNGTIFKLNPATGKLTILYKFSGTDGANPVSSLVTFGNDGFLYGTTTGGGNDVCTYNESNTCGTIFKINPTTGELTTLYKFSGTDGDTPNGSLVSTSSDGFLYGTTAAGGKDGNCVSKMKGCGTIFKINPTTGEFTLLYQFVGKDGMHLLSSLTTFNNDGFLYGTAFDGGVGYGTIFKINPITGKETTLHVFSKSDGANPYASLMTIDKDGYLYGTTANGFSSDCELSGCGTIFKINPTTGVFTVMSSF